MANEFQKVEQAKGRPLLQWVGKKPLESIEFYPAQEKEIYGDKNATDFNKLFWGDNLQVLAHLLKQHRGVIDLIYIDPPFDSKADYVKKVKIRGERVEGEQQGLLEEKQYTDIWEKDEYLQFMYERLILMRELLSDTGVIYLHCDHRKEHHLRMLLDEVFGEENYLNTISWRSQVARGKKVDAFYYAYSTHYIHIYAHTREKAKWHKQVREELITQEEAEQEYMKDGGGYFRTSDPGTSSFDGLMKAVKQNRVYVSKGGELVIDEKKREIKTTKGTIGIKYYLEKRGNHYVEKTTIDNLWADVPGLGTSPAQDVGYPTQKTEQLLKRVIEASTDVGDFVADFFMGSGTTCAVAQKLGRRWVGCDINLGSIQTTTKRLNQIISEQIKEKKGKLLSEFGGSLGFKVFNVNDYDLFNNEIQAKEIVMEQYRVEPIKQSYFDGVLDNSFVKVMPLNRVLNKMDIRTLLKSVSDKLDSFTVKAKSKSGEAIYEEGVLVVCSGMELDVTDFLKKENKTGVKMEVRDIITDKKNLIFKKRAEAKIEAKTKDKKLTVELKDFYSPRLMQKLEIENEKVVKKDQRAKVSDFRQIIDSVMIDVDYDGKLFNAEVIDLPDKKEVIKAKYEWEYPKKGKYTVAVKVVDVLGEEDFETFEVTI
jgi:site-specific DNA-methyltransferase (adenine-specific)/adenine-specific DNA-methyltransferase